MHLTVRLYYLLEIMHQAFMTLSTIKENLMPISAHMYYV